MRFALYFGISLAFLAIDLPTRADDQLPSIAPEAAKAAALTALMRGKRFEPMDHYVEERWRSAMGEPLPQWCQRFFDDFRTQRNVSHIEPLARAQRYGDPVLRPWQDRCPTLALNEISVGKILKSDRFKWGIKEADSNAEALWSGGMLPNYEFGVGAFKLFEVDIDNDPADGVETLFSSERYYWYWPVMAQRESRPGLPPVDRNWNDILAPETVPPDLIRSGQSYTVLDFRGCRVSSQNDVVGGGSNGTGPAGERSLSGIIRYAGRNFLYNVDVEQGAMAQTEIDSGEAPRYGYFVSLTAVARNDEKWETAELCEFGTPSDP
jgi:hypothetical protein